MILHRRNMLAAGCALLGASSLQAEESPAPLCSREADELWTLDTRSLPCGELSSDHDSLWSVHRSTHCGGRTPANLRELISSLNDGRKTIVFVHGNRIEGPQSIGDGQAVYRSLSRCSTEPIRFITWSWCADQIRGPVRDIRTKARYANAEAYRFGWFLSQLPSASPLGIVSFSYGSRVIGGGLHLAAGGCLHGQTVSSGNRPAMRAIMWAPASDCDWLLPGRYHGLALESLSRLTVCYNSADPALRGYQHLEKGSRSRALGREGLCSISCLGQARARYCQYDVADTIGRSHDMHRYHGCEFTRSLTTREALWEA